MFTVTFEGLCGFAKRGDGWDVHFAGAPHHHMAGPGAHEHHPILMSRSLDFLWPTDDAGASQTLMPDELVTIGTEQLALWHLKADLVAKAPGGGPIWIEPERDPDPTMINLEAAHPNARIKSVRREHRVLGLSGGFLHASSIRPEKLVLFREGARPGTRIEFPTPGYFAQTVEWSSMGGDVVFTAGEQTIKFARNARLTLTNSAPDIDAIKHDHFGAYYDLITLAPGDTRLFLDFATGVRFGGEVGNCPPGVRLPSY